jgi:uncharacterized phage protein (TIGR01671 family)
LGGFDAPGDYAILKFLPNSRHYHTGLQDKTGKSIYEGDLLKLDQCPEEALYKISFIEGAFCMAFVGGEYDSHYAMDMHYIQHAESETSTVIGNIYQNPELCKN